MNKLFNQRSIDSPGLLYHLKTAFDHRNVSSDVMKCFNHVSEFLRWVSPCSFLWIGGIVGHSFHNDVIKWKHLRVVSTLLGESTGLQRFPTIIDLRRHRVYHETTVMFCHDGELKWWRWLMIVWFLNPTYTNDKRILVIVKWLLTVQ